MTPEQTLDRIRDILAHHINARPDALPDDLAATLQRVLSHGAATGAIPRRGYNWLSEEDRLRLHKEMHARRFVMTAPLIGQFLAGLDRCETGDEVMRLTVESVIEASRALTRANEMAIDAMNRVPRPMFIAPASEDKR